ncbi:MAG TPA: hypothetical protein DCE41_36055 [Cytophagales bacterium]|nr:hypothetical protein [Cytophagales bacterium]HAA17696.1 hypothetical protein [Cytophagales bacterium]HAP62488.1 hypothetical protein [Cytophagales bacterium]
MSETQEHGEFTVVIDSIGSASPMVSQVLSDAFQIPSELIVKVLYSTPSVLLHEIEEELATRAVELLQQLGLQVRKQSSEDPLPPTPEALDVGVYIPDAALLPQICHQITDFVGCSQQEALNLLLNEPCVVLGGVSRATAEALDNRLDAEVIVSDPKSAEYTLEVLGEDAMLLKQLQTYLDRAGISIDLKTERKIYPLAYMASQELWRRYQSTGMVKLSNHDFQRYEVVLTGVDEGKPDYKAKLVEFTGMPEEIVEEVLENLPIQVEASVNSQKIEEVVSQYTTEGLMVDTVLLEQTHHKLVVEEIQDMQKSREVLSQYIPQEELPTKIPTPWYAPVPMNDLMVRYVAAQLEAIGCEVDVEPLQA